VKQWRDSDWQSSESLSDCECDLWLWVRLWMWLTSDWAIHNSWSHNQFNDRQGGSIDPATEWVSQYQWLAIDCFPLLLLLVCWCWFIRWLNLNDWFMIDWNRQSDFFIWKFEVLFFKIKYYKIRGKEDLAQDPFHGIPFLFLRKRTGLWSSYHEYSGWNARNIPTFHRYSHVWEIKRCLQGDGHRYG